MSVVELLLNVMGPVVLVIALGWVAGRRMDFDVATLSRLAFWVIGPMFMLDVFADAELERSTALLLAFGGLVGMAVAGLAAFAGTKALSVSSQRVKASVMTGSFGNVGNAGLAISAFAFGDDAIPSAAVLMVTINAMGIFLGVALASAGESGLLSAVRRSLLTPISMAAILALTMNALGLEFPLMFERSISIVGSALIPLMLVTLGIQLAGNFTLDLTADIAVVMVAKLAIAPIIAAAVGYGLGLREIELGVLVIQSCMPPAVFSAVVAMEFDLEPERVTSTVLGATLVSLLTIPIALVAVT